MQIAGDFRVKAAASRVYDFFVDPVTFIDALDDPHEIHATDPDHFEGTVTTGVAFIRGTFRLRGSYTLKTPPSEVRVHLQGSGLGSGVDADLELTLTEAAGETSLHWTGRRPAVGADCDARGTDRERDRREEDRRGVRERSAKARDRLAAGPGRAGQARNFAGDRANFRWHASEQK